MNEKGREKKVNQATDLGEKCLFCLKWKWSTLVTPSLLFLWKSLEVPVGITRMHLWLPFSFGNTVGLMDDGHSSVPLQRQVDPGDPTTTAAL